ncbi:MAG: thioredoxin family protein [Planctomycetaceae bacterium]|nr:thioredoxin family protein [Planctomycetaceae bacterium]
MRTLSIALLILCLSSARTPAGEFNPVRKIGDPSPAWKKLPGTDGKLHSLDDLKNRDVVVVVFTCNSCPYAVDYEDRLIAFHKKFASRNVALVAINVNKVTQDALPEMKKRAKTKGFAFPYLFDGSQKIAREFGALFTPEFFVLNKQRKIVYMGSMDNNPSPKKVSKRYLDDAIAAVLAGKKVPTKETIAFGCQIRFERKRRKRKKKSTTKPK